MRRDGFADEAAPQGRLGRTADKAPTARLTLWPVGAKGFMHRRQPRLGDKYGANDAKGVGDHDFGQSRGSTRR